MGSAIGSAVMETVGPLLGLTVWLFVFAVSGWTVNRMLVVLGVPEEVTPLLALFLGGLLTVLVVPQLAG